MKTLLMLSAFSYHPFRNVTIQYEAGHIYRRVPEAAARQILKAKAGRVIDGAPAEPIAGEVQAPDERAAPGGA
jgi:hypothetical protein